MCERPAKARKAVRGGEAVARGLSVALVILAGLVAWAAAPGATPMLGMPCLAPLLGIASGAV